MIYAYRVQLPGAFSPPHYEFGFVSAAYMVDLYWAIDEFIDPNVVKIKKIGHVSFCFKARKIDGFYEPTIKHGFDLGDNTIMAAMMADDDGWKDPPWLKPNWHDRHFKGSY